MKRIFLTGASSGIGLAIAERLCREGHEVWGTSRDPARLPSLDQLHPVRLDLADLAGIPGTFETSWREAGYFDVLINNAGSGHFDPAETLLPEKVEPLFRTLVFAHMELCNRAAMKMIRWQSLTLKKSIDLFLKSLLDREMNTKTIALSWE